MSLLQHVLHEYWAWQGPDVRIFRRSRSRGWLPKFGRNVVLLEALDRILARVAGKELSDFYEAEHRAHGVDLRTSVTVEAIDVDDRKVTGVQLVGGEIIPADMAIVGIGIIPAVAPLLEAGANGGNGVNVDLQCRTDLPDVFAIGDCAAHANKYAQGHTMRVESVQNAHDQAALVAKLIMGQDVTYESVPWFWSDQYDLKLQTVGLNVGYAQTVLKLSRRTCGLAKGIAAAVRDNFSLLLKWL